MTSSELTRLRTEVGEIVAKHGSQSRQDFSKYYDDLVGFFREVLHREPWSKQVEMLEMVRDNPRCCFVSANSVGKDWAMSRLALWFCYAVVDSSSSRA